MTLSSPHPPPPQGEGGRGEGGAPTTAPKRPKGEGAPQGAAGWGRRAERGQGAHDSPRAERRKPDPQGRADPAHGPTRQNPNFVELAWRVPRAKQHNKIKGSVLLGWVS